MDAQRQDDQLEPLYNSSVPIRDVALKTYREPWTIEKGGGRGSGRSVQAVRQEYTIIFLIQIIYSYIASSILTEYF